MSIEKKDIADIELAARLDRIEDRLTGLEKRGSTDNHKVTFTVNSQEIMADIDKRIAQLTREALRRSSMAYETKCEAGTETHAPNSFGSIITAKGNLRKGK